MRKFLAAAILFLCLVPLESFAGSCGKPALNVLTGNVYPSIYEAYNDPGGVTEIRLAGGAASVIENVAFDGAAKAIKLTGGWNCSNFSPAYPYSKIHGSLTVSGGNQTSVTVDRIAIYPGVVTIPQPPSNLQATLLSGMSIGLTWTDNSNNESGFRPICEGYLYGTDYTVWNVGDVGPGVTSRTVTGLDPCTAYSCYVMAFNSAGESAHSNTIGIDTCPPFDPSNLQATAMSSSSILLTWTDNSNNETGFVVTYRPLGSPPWTNWPDLGPNTTSTVVTGLQEGTTYEFYVTSFNPAGANYRSNLAQATTLSPVPAAPNAPSNLSVEPVDKSSTSLRLVWNDNSGNETGFRIERSTDGSNWSLVQSPGDGVTSWVDTNRTPCTTYYYRVAAVNLGGNSGYATASGKTAPAAPTNLQASGGAAVLGVLLDWNASTCVVKYRIYECDDECYNGAYNYTVLGDVPLNGADLGGVDPLLYNGYRVSAIDADGHEGSLSCTVAAGASWMPATSPGDTCRAARGWAASPRPSNPWASEGNYVNEVKVTWNAVQLTWNYMGQGSDTYATKYKFWYSYDATGNYETMNWQPQGGIDLVVPSVPAAITFPFEPAAPNYWVHFKISVSDTADPQYYPDGFPEYPAYASGWAAAQGGVSNTPGTPLIDATAHYPGAIGVYWSEITGATYDVERSATSGSTGFVRLYTNVSFIWFTDTPAPCGKYWYRVRALKGGFTGAWSSSVAGTCL